MGGSVFGAKLSRLSLLADALAGGLFFVSHLNLLS
jgi:hypothetical protein